MLGYTCTEDGVKPDYKRMDVIKNWPRPSTVTEMRSFLDTIVWDSESIESFDKLKNALKYEALAYPQFNKNEFIIAVDSSSLGCGAVLKQIQMNNDGVETERTIAYASKLFNNHERKWSITEKECFGILWACTDAFHRYIYGTTFLVRTDHKPLINITHKKMANERLQRWSLRLQDYDMKVEHIDGSKHVDADAISRLAYLENFGESTSVMNSININQLYQNTNYVNSIEIRNNNKEKIKNINAISHSGMPKDIIIKEQDKDLHLNDIKKYIIAQRITKKEFLEKRKNVSNIQKSKIDEPIKLEEKKILTDAENQKNNVAKYLKNKFHWKRRYVNKIAKINGTRNLEEIIKGYHDSPDMAHYGIKMSQYKIRQKYYWFKMDEDIKNYVQSCIKCQTRNSSPFQKVRTPIVDHDLVPKIFDTAIVDVWGPVTESKNKNKYVITFLDPYSRFIEAFATKDATANTIAKLLVNKVLLRYGPIRILQSDRASSFLSELVKEVCLIFKIQKLNVAGYHPQSNARLERMHKGYAQMLSKLVNEEQNDWDEYLNWIVHAYRITKQSMTNLSPYEV
eukprot:Awhi_evm1s39